MNKIIPAVTQVVAINSRPMYIQMKGVVDTFIISAYAPTSVDTDQNNNIFYATGTDVWNHLPGNFVTTLGGDFSATIRTRIGEDVTNFMGNFYLRARDGMFERTATTTIDNRQRFINMCSARGLSICNTEFDEPSINYAPIDL